MDLFKDNEFGLDKYMENNDWGFVIIMLLDRELGFIFIFIGLFILFKLFIFDIICKGIILWIL